MKYRALVAAIAAGIALPATAIAAPFNSLAAVHQLSNEQAAAHLSADFDATVIFYRSYEGTLFVQDGDNAIYIQPNKTYNLTPGDRIHIHGTTEESFRPFVGNAAITHIGRAAMPPAPLADFESLVQATYDCRYVRVRGRVLSADIVQSSDRPSTNVQLLTDGGTIEAQIESNNPDALPALLDSEVEVSGALSGRFDGKMQIDGVTVPLRG